MTQDDLDRVKFKEYLEAQAPGSEVGTCGVSTHCPLAQWLKAFGPGVTCVEVGYDAIFIDSLDGEECITSPDWVREFVTAADRINGEQHGWPVIKPVTREQALAILEAIW